MRLIDADELIKDTESLCNSTQFGRTSEKMFIKRDPTRKPVKRRKWIEHFEKLECFECLSIWYHFDNDTERFNFCPNCGADMRAEAHP